MINHHGAAAVLAPWRDLRCNPSSAGDSTSLDLGFLVCRLGITLQVHVEWRALAVKVTHNCTGQTTAAITFTWISLMLFPWLRTGPTRLIAVTILTRSDPSALLSESLFWDFTLGLLTAEVLRVLFFQPLRNAYQKLWVYFRHRSSDGVTERDRAPPGRQRTKF